MQASTSPDLLLQVATALPAGDTPPGAAEMGEEASGPSVDVFRFSRSLEDQAMEIADDLMNRLIPAAHGLPPRKTAAADAADLFGGTARRAAAAVAGRILPPAPMYARVA